MSAIITYPDTENRQADTSKITLDKILQAINGGGGGGSSSGAAAAQIYEYTGTDPTSDGILPTRQDRTAIAYKQDGTAPTYVWNTSTRAWV